MAEEIQINTQDLRDYIKNASLFSDTYFRAFLQNKTYKPAEYLIRKFLKNPFIIVRNMEIQKVIDNVGGRGIRLDFYCEELAEDGTVKRRFNIEIQRSSEGAVAVRARYYSSSIDSNALKKGEDIRSLSETYVIFIAEKDIFKKGQELYHIQRYIEICDDKGNITKLEPFKDGSHIIYINGEFEDISTDIGKIVHDLKCVNPDEMLCDELRKPALYLKQTEGGFKEVEAIYKDNVQRIINESKDKWIEAGEKVGILEGEKIGEKNGLWKTAKNLLKLGLPLDKIAEATTLEPAEIQAMALTMA